MVMTLALAEFLILAAAFLKKDLNIILADDDPDDQSFFTDAIHEAEQNISLQCVCDGVELLDYLDKTSSLPDLIFLDLNMPKCNGLDCLKIIRANKKFQEIPIIIYSTSSNQKDIDKAFSAGANFYFTKPASYITLKKKLNWLISQDYSQKISRELFAIN